MHDYNVRSIHSKIKIIHFCRSYRFEYDRVGTYPVGLLYNLHLPIT